MRGNTFLPSNDDIESRCYERNTMSVGKDLSEREMAVLQCIAQGMNTNEVAEKLCISVNTVETHRRHLNEKLGARNTASLVMNAVRFGLIAVFED